MENLILSRLVLLLFVAVNLFIGARSDSVWHPLNKKAVHCFFGTEVLLLTAYIIYDNLMTPPYCAMIFAVIGYLFVYFFWTISYLSYIFYTNISIDKEYDAEMLGEYVYIESNYYFCCKIKDDYGIYLTAYIPIEQILIVPQNKEKDISGMYKEWSADGEFRKDYMKYKMGDVIKVKYRGYICRQKYLIVTVI